jgi:hypothetical protein
LRNNRSDVFHLFGLVRDHPSFNSSDFWQLLSRDLLSPISMLLNPSGFCCNYFFPWQKLPPFTKAGFDLTTHAYVAPIFSETIPLDHAATLGNLLFFAGTLNPSFCRKLNRSPEHFWPGWWALPPLG